MKRFAVAVAPLLLLAGGCGGGADLDKVASACSTDDAGLSTSDGGDSLIIDASTIDAEGQPSLRVRYANAAAFCALDEIGAPQSFKSDFEQTSANDGIRKDSVDGLDLSWSYEPDDGISLIIEKG